MRSQRATIHNFSHAGMPLHHKPNFRAASTMLRKLAKKPPVSSTLASRS